MRQARFLAPWKDSWVRPSIYHVISRVVDRQFVLGDLERERFRTLMRMQENFSGCRILSYCVMSNHFHILLEVPPMPECGLTDAQLLERLAYLYSEAHVAEVATQLKQAREIGNEVLIAEIHARYSYRMHDLSQFMKSLLQRFSSWFNRSRNRSGVLWEQRYKSVIVEDGAAARTIAAYIDLNPLRAGMVKDPAHYRWSSYGEAVGGGAKGNGKKAREGLVRAWTTCHSGQVAADAWQEVSKAYRRLLLHGGKEKVKEVVANGRLARKTLRKGMSAEQVRQQELVAGDLPMATMLHCRIRYFTDGVVIGSRAFVNDVFDQARDRFGPKRPDGARKLKGSASPASGQLWSLRDLRVGV